MLPHGQCAILPSARSGAAWAPGDGRSARRGQDKNDRQFSGNLYHAYRKMAHYSDAVDPHSKCVNPRHDRVSSGVS